MTINPHVIDISHYDAVDADGFQKAAAFGIWGVIHKSSESTGVVDRMYAPRKQPALAAGLLWGAYHFMRPTDIKAQVDLFMRAAAPDANTLMAVDYEDSNVSLDQLREFIELTEARLGRKLVIYSGNTIKEKLGNRVDPFYGERRLWLAQYSASPVLQKSWQRYWLWQYTGDGAGQPPHNVPGIHIAGGLDISSYDGTKEQLAREWSGAGGIVPVPTPSPQATPLQIAKWLQMALNELGQEPPLKVDGDIGPKTLQAITDHLTP